MTQSRNSKDPATLALHADDGIEDAPDVAPPLHSATTYRATTYRAGDPGDNAAGNPNSIVYGREETVTRRRLEAVLGALEGGHAVTYASGQAAAHAALLHCHPRRVAIEGGYHGTHALLEAFGDGGLEVVGLDASLDEGDLVWLETPRNPTCVVEDIAAHVQRAHRAGARVLVDSTFATPVLQRPLTLGADLVMHSSTKFLGGIRTPWGACCPLPMPRKQMNCAASERSSGRCRAPWSAGSRYAPCARSPCG